MRTMRVDSISGGCCRLAVVSRCIDHHEPNLLFCRVLVRVVLHDSSCQALRGKVASLRRRPILDGTEQQ